MHPSSSCPLPRNANIHTHVSDQFLPLFLSRGLAGMLRNSGFECSGCHVARTRTGSSSRQKVLPKGFNIRIQGTNHGLALTDNVAAAAAAAVTVFKEMAGTDRAHREAASSEKHSLYVTIFVVLSWYIANIALVLLNKFLLSTTQFRQPVFLSLCHMLACVVMGLAISATGCTPVKPLKSRQQFIKIAVLSVMFCASIVLGNASLKYIPVSFNQAIGATTPFFTAVFAFMLQGTRESFITYMTLVPIVGGIAIASGGEPLFQILGFAFCLLATAGRALKSVSQSMILSDPSEKLDAMSLLLYMSAICVLLLLPLTCVLEPDAPARTMQLMASSPNFIWWLLMNSLLAYFVNLTNFLVTKFTSPLTLQVLGNAKGVIAAIISIYIFLNPVTVSGILGYALTLAGVFLYSESKRRSKTISASPQEHKLESKNSGLPSMLNAACGDASVVVSIANTSVGHRDSPRSTPRKEANANGDPTKGNSYIRDVFFRHTERTEPSDDRVVRAA